MTTFTMKMEEDALGFFKAKIQELDKAIAAHEIERNALASLLDAAKKTEDNTDYPKQRELSSVGVGIKTEPEPEPRPKKSRSVKKQSKTASDYLKNPELGVKGSILKSIGKKNRKDSGQLIEEIVDISRTDPAYKKVANSIRQSLRAAVESGELQQYRDGRLISYGRS